MGLCFSDDLWATYWKEKKANTEQNQNKTTYNKASWKEVYSFTWVLFCYIYISAQLWQWISTAVIGLIQKILVVSLLLIFWFNGMDHYILCAAKNVKKSEMPHHEQWSVFQIILSRCCNHLVFAYLSCVYTTVHL